MGHVFPAGQWPRWAAKDFWAPEIHWVNGNFLVYFSARKSMDNLLAIGLARSDFSESAGYLSRQTSRSRSSNSSNPLGPYEDLGAPLLEDPLGVIDAHWFFDRRSQRPYFVWKTDDNAIGQPSSIYVREMNPEGTDFAPGSKVTAIMTADQPDDVNVVEGASIVWIEPYYYLIFSGGLVDYNN
jgi:beta-xylosidase